MNRTLLDFVQAITEFTTMNRCENNRQRVMQLAGQLEAEYVAIAAKEILTEINLAQSAPAETIKQETIKVPEVGTQKAKYGK